MEAYYLRFETADITQRVFRQLSETNIKKFFLALGINPDPGNHPLYLQLIVDYYCSSTISTIARFLGVNIDVFKDYRLIAQFRPSQAATAQTGKGDVIDTRAAA